MCAAPTTLLAVEIMSSKITTVLPSTGLPIRLACLVSVALERRLSTMEMAPPSFFWYTSAFLMLPSSGLSTTKSRSGICRERTYSLMTGPAYRWSTGMSKKPWIWAACRSRASTRSAPAVVSRSATSLAVMGTRPTSLRSCRA